MQWCLCIMSLHRQWDQKKSNEGILGTSHIGKTPLSFFSLANAYSDTGVLRDPLCWMGLQQ